MVERITCNIIEKKHCATSNSKPQLWDENQSRYLSTYFQDVGSLAGFQVQIQQQDWPTPITGSFGQTYSHLQYDTQLKAAASICIVEDLADVDPMIGHLIHDCKQSVFIVTRQPLRIHCQPIQNKRVVKTLMRGLNCVTPGSQKVDGILYEPAHTRLPDFPVLKYDASLDCYISYHDFQSLRSPHSPSHIEIRDQLILARKREQVREIRQILPAES